MKLFQCQHCRALLYFENTQCGSCGRSLGYLPSRETLTALEPSDAAWRALAEPQGSFRYCANAQHAVWGGDGIVAINSFINARDDHVMLLSPSSAFIAHPYTSDKLSYDPRELSPVARITSTLISITVPPSLGVSSLQEFFTMARAQPGKLNWVSTTGATDLILHAYIKKSGLDMVRVPYRNPVEALTDTVNGRVHIYWAAHAIIQAQAQAGNVKIIAITNSEPTSLLPGIPTVTQAGFSDLTLDGLIGIFSQRDLPQSARDRIAADVKAALDDPSIHTRLTATGQVVVPGTAAELAASIEKQRAGLVEVAKVLGIKAATYQ